MTPPVTSQTPVGGVDLGPPATRFRPAAAPTPQRDTTERAREIPLAREAAATAPMVVDVLPRNRSEIACRVVNATMATGALILLAPLLVIVALLIKLTSPGPILYVQTRVGLDRRRASGRKVDVYDRRARDLGGQVFAIYKFRSMYVDAERRSGVVWATRGDPRITPIGRLMRKCRIDELPQFINVLKGDMNIVGPRPERPSIFARLREGIPDYAARQRAKPGITGLAQINQAPDASIDDVKTKVRYDIEYVKRQGLVEDARIMAKTVPVVLFRWTGW